MMNEITRNMEINEEELKSVSGGLSNEMAEKLLAERESYIKMWKNGEISDEILLKLVEEIDNKLFTPGCTA